MELWWQFGLGIDHSGRSVLPELLGIGHKDVNGIRVYDI